MAVDVSRGAAGADPVRRCERGFAEVVMARMSIRKLCVGAGGRVVALSCLGRGCGCGVRRAAVFMLIVIWVFLCSLMGSTVSGRAGATRTTVFPRGKS